MKTCIKCGETKCTSEFYPKKSSKDGFRTECKDCIKLYQKLRYKNPATKILIKKYQEGEKYQSYRKQYTATNEYKSRQEFLRQDPRRKAKAKEYRLSERGKEVHLKSHAKYCLNNPEKRKAKDAIHAEVRYGRLAKASTFPCVKCGKKASEYHHCFGYEPKDWLKVIPLCRQCHVDSHKLSA